MTLSTALKNTLFLLIILKIAPPLLMSIKNQYTAFFEPRTKVGVLTIDDCLYDSQRSIQQLKKFFKDTDIRAILIKMNCIGGYPGSAQAFYTELRALKEEYSKTVGVYVENVCASGGYYAASAADFIVATPSAFVGSIGVYIQQPQLKEFINQFKIQYTVTKTGAYKTTGDMFLAPTEHGNAMLQTLTDDTYNQFITDVVNARPHLTKETASTWADGKIFTGNKARELGLIDAVGSACTTEKLLRKKTPIDGEIEWVYAQEPRSLINNLLNSTEDADNSSFAKQCIYGIMHVASLLFNLPH